MWKTMFVGFTLLLAMALLNAVQAEYLKPESEPHTAPPDVQIEEQKLQVSTSHN